MRSGMIRSDPAASTPTATHHPIGMTTGSRRPLNVGPAMVAESFAFLIYLAVSGERTTTLAILGAIFALQFGIMLILQRIFRPDAGDDDEPGRTVEVPGGRATPCRTGHHRPAWCAGPSSSASSPSTSPGS